MNSCAELLREHAILYVLTYDTLDEAIALHNDVPQGLSFYMRPATNTINYSGELALAQGVSFL